MEDRLLLPRGSGPLVSVLIPSRGRTEALKRAVWSLLGLVEDRNSVEILVKVDEDDFATLDTIRQLGQPQVVPVVSPRGYGYGDIPRYFTEMCVKARGDWLFIMNDDAVMTTVGWDSIVAYASYDAEVSGSDELQFRIVQVEGKEYDYGFFFVRRKVFEVLGHLFLSPLGDTWLFNVMLFMGLVLEFPIVVAHNRILDDATRREGERALVGEVQRFKGLLGRRAMLEDATMLLHYLEER